MSRTDGRRVAKVEKEVQQAIAEFLIRGVGEPLPALVTVARVLMPADLRSAKVYISVLGGADPAGEGSSSQSLSKMPKEVIKTLQGNASEIQRYIGQKVRMKYCPRITFFLDDTTDQILKIDRILHDLNQENQKKKGSE